MDSSVLKIKSREVDAQQSAIVGLDDIQAASDLYRWTITISEDQIKSKSQRPNDQTHLRIVHGNR